MNSPPTLCYITDRKWFPSSVEFSDFLINAAKTTIDLIQIREKDLQIRALIGLASTAIETAKGFSSRTIINDRMDVALAVGAAGVHLGIQSLPASIARKMAPPGFLVGVSCHSWEEAANAEAAGADYILLGPVFETPSKLDYGPPLGLSTFRTVAQRVKLPVLALGGITIPRVKLCMEAGATGIAGIRIFQECSSIAARVRELRAELQP